MERRRGRRELLAGLREDSPEREPRDGGGGMNPLQLLELSNLVRLHPRVLLEPAIACPPLERHDLGERSSGIPALRIRAKSPSVVRRGTE